MILPIRAYGESILKTPANDVEEDDTHIKELVSNMYETMYNAEGVGLAAPQVGEDIRAFIIDTRKIDQESGQGLQEVFINPEIVTLIGANWTYEEGCLSIPHIRENLERPEKVTINYLDLNFKEQEQTFEGITGRVIQHEFDHVEGILFTDHLSSLKKRLLKKKLQMISGGEVNTSYKMKFPTKTKKKAI